MDVDDPAAFTARDRPASQSTPATKPRRENKLDAFLKMDDVSRAEIAWCLRTVASNLSLRASSDCIVTMQQVLTDSEICHKMKFKKDKISYSIVYGIAPHFESELYRCENIFVGFDESLNTVSQRSQMDICVRFLHPNSGEVCWRYLNSSFLQRTRAVDLLDGLKTALRATNDIGILRKLEKLSIDGPNVHWKLLRDFNVEIEALTGTKLIDVGSCGLHVVHLSFKAGMLSTKWNISGVLRAMHQLFRDSPARRALFVSSKKSKTPVLFPMPFCGVRLLENAKPAERALLILPDLRDFVAHAKDSNTAVSSSFETVSEALKDKFLGTKLAYFSSTAGLLEPFLREFQTDAPTAPFLHGELSAIMLTLLRKVVKPEVMNYLNDATKVDLKNKENLIPVKKFDIGFAAKDEFRKVKKASDLEIVTLKQQMQTCVIKMIEKLMERSPLKYKFVKSISCFDPAVAVKPVLG